jgi:hypothetical protein
MHTVRSTVLALNLTGALILGGCVNPAVELDRGPETAPEGLTALPTANGEQTGQKVSFHRQIKPILESKCLACHRGASAPWSYSLETKERAFAQGAAGPRIIPGEPDRSIIVSFASTHKNVAAMPIVGNRLTETESRLLRRWILEGAYWPEGRSGMLKADSHALRPETALMRKEWRAWFEKDDSTK